MVTPVPAPRLRGREAELRALGDAVQQVASGHPAVVLVEGEAGIGKTRLLTETLTGARSRGLQVVAGRAQELERTRPFGVLADALACTPTSPDPRRRALAALLATRVGERGTPQTVSSDPGLQFQAVDAFGDLLESLAVTGPLVAGLDDLQWSDPSSLLTLPELIPEVAARVNQLLAKAAALVRERFGGRVTYAAIHLERVDWTCFDIVSMDLYRSAEVADGFADGVRALTALGKPVAITEFGAATYRGAGDRGARGLEIVEHD